MYCVSELWRHCHSAARAEAAYPVTIFAQGRAIGRPVKPQVRKTLPKYLARPATEKPPHGGPSSVRSAVAVAMVAGGAADQRGTRAFARLQREERKLLRSGKRGGHLSRRVERVRQQGDVVSACAQVANAQVRRAVRLLHRRREVADDRVHGNRPIRA
eukprot:1264348-Pyramimonas_sp.AAC.1